MQWWCSAQGIAWTWTWRPYVGVWLLILLFAVSYWRLYHRAGRMTGGDGAVEPMRIASAVAGVLCLWIALDWPVGLLGAGYLASVHMVQFILISVVAPPMLLFGIPPVLLARFGPRPNAGRTARSVLVPLIGIVGINVVVVATHAPLVVDSLMPTQLGSFALDIIWLVSSLAFWWPLVWSVPGDRPLPAPAKIGYLFAGTFAHTGVAMYLLLSQFPVYRTYELAPPIAGITPLGDQEVAGGLMLIAGILLVLGTMTAIFFQWQRELERNEIVGAPGP
jgi:putative membrane protein